MVKTFSGQRHFICRVLTLLLVFIGGCAGSTSKSNLFSSADFEGQWGLVDFGQHTYIRFNSNGALLLNAKGEILQGNFHNLSVDYQKFTDGALIMSETGSGTGSITSFLPDSSTYQKYVISNGQMTARKDMFVFAGDFTLSNKGIGVFVRDRGPVSTTDLQGDWFIPLDGSINVSVDKEGKISSCAYMPAGKKEVPCSGSFSITPEGEVFVEVSALAESAGSPGSDTWSRKILETRIAGKMDEGKDAIALSGELATEISGIATLAVRKAGSYSPYEAEGNWKVFASGFRDALYGTITVNNAGGVTGGNWTTVKGVQGVFSESKFSLSGEGKITGSLITSTGMTYTFLGGQLCSSKELAETVHLDSEGHYGVMIFVKSR